MQARMVVIAQAALFVVEDVFQRGQLRRHGEELVDLLLVLHGGVRDLGVLQDVGHLLGDRVGIHGHGHGADPLRGRHGPIEPRPVVADDGDLAAALEPEGLQTHGVGAHGVVHLGPGPGLPDAQVLVTDRGPARTHPRVAGDQLRKGVLTSGNRRRHHLDLP
jgi:hypothetical protein